MSGEDLRTDSSCLESVPADPREKSLKSLDKKVMYMAGLTAGLAATPAYILLGVLLGIEATTIDAVVIFIAPVISAVPLVVLNYKRRKIQKQLAGGEQ